MSRAPLEARGYCAVGPAGQLMLTTLRSLKRDTIYALEKVCVRGFVDLKRNGYRVVKVLVTEAVPKSKPDGLKDGGA